MPVKLNVCISITCLILIFLSQIFACGPGRDSSSDEGGSRYRAKLIFPQDVVVGTEGVNCEASGIAIIEFNFFLDGQQYGPYRFSCSDHNIAIRDVPAGLGVEVEVSATDATGRALYEGFEVVDIIKGRETIGGEIEMIPVSSSGSTTTDTDSNIDEAVVSTGDGGIEIPELNMTFSYIPAGEFDMGSPPENPGRGNSEYYHRVRLTSDFFMQTTEVTQAQWLAVMNTDENPSAFSNCPDCPVENVSYNWIVSEFLPRLNERYGEHYDFRLPTEAEWEYATRARTTTPYFFGEMLSTDEANFSSDGTMLVGSFEPNAWGLFDIHGNVWEWCSDWYEEVFTITGNPEVNPQGPLTGEERVLRGGSWVNTSNFCRSAFRNSQIPSGRYSSIGFRVAASFVSQ